MLIALLIGYFIVLLDGIFFIMVTLALGEMFHAWVFTSELLGGSDGLPGVMRPDFTLIGIDSNDPLTFSFYCISHLEHLPPWYIQLIVAIGALWIIFNRSVEGPVRASNATVNAYQGVASNGIIGQLDF